MTEATVGPITKTVEFDGTMENAYGSALDKAISFEGSYEHILNYENIPAKEQPDNDDVLSFVNAKRKANARQKVMQAALDAAGVKKPTLEDPQFQLKQMIKILVTAGRSEENARQVAEATLGTKLV